MSAAPAVTTPVDGVLAALLRGVVPLPPVALPLRAAAGLVTAEDIRAPTSLPRFTNSAMDGFAVRARDLRPSATVRLGIVGQAWAGAPWTGTVRAGEAVQVATGAALPDGADTVVPVEQAVVEHGTVLVPAYTVAGAHVRPAGEDVARDDVLVRAGEVLGPGQLSACAAVGLQAVRVHPRARVAIVPTGTEVRPAGAVLGAGEIHDAVSLPLALLLEQGGAYPCPRPPVPDDTGAIMAALKEAALDADVLLTVGGVSAGERDLVRQLNTVGHVDPYRVALRPAKPFAFGRMFGLPLVGLPGNPAAALIAFEVLARPLVMRLQGRSPLPRPAVQARLTEPVEGSPDRLRLLGMRVWRAGEALYARPVPRQGAGMVHALAAANGWHWIPAGTGPREPGEEIAVGLLAEPGEE